jgi:hypothetical protein
LKKKTSKNLPKAGLKEKLFLYGLGVSLIALFIGMQRSNIRPSRPKSFHVVPPFFQAAEAGAPLPVTLALTQFTEPTVAQAL